MRIRIKAKEIVYRCGMLFFCLFPIKKNKVLFLSYFGLSYSDSPAAISGWLEKNAPSIDIVWALRENARCSERVRKVSTTSIRYIYELATAKVWVDNCRKRAWMVKRKGQYYMQTWHGGIPLKKVEKDAYNQLEDVYIHNAKNDAKMTDVMLAECEWRAQNYRNAFWYSGEIMTVGLPRSDVFFSDRNLLREKVHSFYSLPADMKIAVYAPTFRSSKTLDYLDFNYRVVVSALEKRFGGEWVFLIRLHPNMADYQESITYSNTVMNGSEYPDMNELLCGSDVLLTDYSGCLFDGIYLQMPSFIYAPDLETYKSKERSLYFDITALPAPFAKTESQLIKNIQCFDEKAYIQLAEAFINEMGYRGDGHATEAAAQRILREIHA